MDRRGVGYCVGLGHSPDRVALRLIVISPCAELYLMVPFQASAPMRVISPVPVEGGDWQVTFQVAVAVPDIAKSLLTHVASGPLPAGGAVHCFAEQTCCGGSGSVMPGITICGVTDQRSPVAWAANPVNEPSD